MHHNMLLTNTFYSIIQGDYDVFVASWGDDLGGDLVRHRGVHNRTDPKRNRQPIQKNRKPQKIDFFWMCLGHID